MSSSVCTESPRKWRKSLLFSGFGVNWPVSNNKALNNSTHSQSTTTTANNADEFAPKRHNSVSFALNMPSSPRGSGEGGVGGGSQKERKCRLRGSYSQSWRSNGTAAHHHGSVQNLVFRQKGGGTTTTTTGTGNASIRSSSNNNCNSVGTIPRRPSTPSLPFSIVQAMTGHSRRQDSCTFSLDEEDANTAYNDDSAYSSSACSSCSCSSSSSSSSCKRASGLSMFSNSTTTTTTRDLLSPPPCHRCSHQGGGAGIRQQKEGIPAATKTYQWTEEQRAAIEYELDQICSQSLGHLFVKCPALAFANLIQQDEMEEGEQHFQSAITNGNDVLCADGKVQFHLLSMVAPAGKRVVNVGQSYSGGGVGHPSITGCCNSASSRCYNYNPNNLELTIGIGRESAQNAGD